MAVVHVGKLRVVSLSPTAIGKSEAIAHVLLERLDKPERNEFGTRPAEDGFYCSTACGVKITARIGPTYIENNPEAPQHRRNCVRCDANRRGGEMSIRLCEPGTAVPWEPPVDYSAQLPIHHESAKPKPHWIIRDYYSEVVTSLRQS